MSTLYVVVAPNFTGKGEYFRNNMKDYSENIQLIDEGAITVAQRWESVSKDENYRNGLIATMVRSHLLKMLDVMVVADNLSMEALVLWRKMATEHNAQCHIILYEFVQESAMINVERTKYGKDIKQKLRETVANQFKQYDEIKAILTNKLSIIARELADEVVHVNPTEDEK